MSMRQRENARYPMHEPRAGGARRGAHLPRRRLLALLGACGMAAAGAGACGYRAGLGSALLPAAHATTPARAVAVGQLAPDMGFTTLDGRRHRLSAFRGRRVMLWLFATWCPTCVEGTASLAGHYAALHSHGLQIIQLGLYENLGHSGPSVESIARRAAGKVYPAAGWLFGTASREGSYVYDPRGIPDRYFLIDRRGILRHVGWAPGVTMGDILAFARHEAG